MIRIIIIGLLATVAMGQMFGGMDLSSMMSNINPEMLKDLTPEKIQDALKNLPPNMKEMMNNMGVDESQLEDMVKNLPKDMDLSALADQVKGQVGFDMDQIKNAMKGMGIEGDLSEVVSRMKKDLLEQVQKDLDIEMENVDTSDIVSKLKEKIMGDLEKQGLDLSHPEELKKQILEEMKVSYGVEPDMDNEEFKQMIVKNIISDLKDEGFDVDPEKPEESLMKLREIANEKAREFGFDFSNGFDFGSMGNNIMEKLRAFGVPVDEPSKLLPYIMEKAQEYMPMIQEMMVAQSMPPVHPIPMGPAPQYGAPLTLNLEINVDGGDRSTNVGMPVSHFSEEEVSELLQDLLHYRTLAKSLIAKNEMLHHRIEALETRRPVMSRSPMLGALMHKYHMEN
ncbi:uncharacterized protein LOC133206092 [Saccostrea echinata]|uniref:uncharacterized protein LOC133206092 n=1 Tax=Saccostrea echinata TaxID=191078 RepID=UPI002A7EAB86|nr:uncharacterized protein LOC133206092 [Saccostrea echinata]